MTGASPFIPRRVQPELLDSLPSDDPAARRSRADLRRLNRIIGSLPIVLRALDSTTLVPRTVLELGAGDGSLMLGLARRRAAHWPGVEATLLDRQPAIAEANLQPLRTLGWKPEVIEADALSWLAQQGIRRWDFVFANLFIHHFSFAQLTSLFSEIAARARVFLCCEPRRGWFALINSRLVGLLGVGPVTRTDAVLSVHAGFQDGELSAAWPEKSNWRVHEYAAGLYSHCLLAVRNTA